ncbi:MAG: hypothetical protein IPJ71_07530 [Bdellovibrionales bacterium]|nr:hypothetical protein [Bdellovibrionales bacterium]
MGKTTLSKALLRDFDYYNYDNPQDRKKIHQGPFRHSNRYPSDFGHW